MATIEISDDWLESVGLSVEEAKAYLLNYPVMAEICLSHMTSTIVRTPLTSIVGFAHILLSGVEGPLTERQNHDLKLIVHSGERLFEHLSHFIYMVSSVFRNHRIYLNKINVNEILTSSVIAATKYCEYKIVYNVPDTAVEIQSDQILFERLLSGLLELAKHVRPTYKGEVAISIEQLEHKIKIGIFTKQDPRYPFQLSSSNPFVFMCHSFAKELKGEFRIMQQENSWQITTLLPIIYE